MVIDRRSAAFACGLVMLVAARAAAADDRKWEVDVHGAFAVATQGASGVGLLGDPSLPLGTVPTWFFGDGGVLLGRISQTFRLSTPTTLDGALRSSFAERGPGGGFGVRVARTVTPRWAVELAFDDGFARTRVSEASRDALDRAGNGFMTTFNALLGLPDRQRSVTSTVAIDDGRGQQLRTTGAVVFNFASRRGLLPYATVGAGATIERDATATAQLVGSYQFGLPNLAGLSIPQGQFHETDTVTVHASPSGAFTSLFGGGIKYARNDRWGLRADLRDHVSANKSTTTVSATPTADRTSGLLAVTFFGVANGASVQMSTLPNVPSTLSGKLLETQTFRGTGVRHQIDATFGVYWRF
jgi:hypothetical protein